MVEGSRMKNKSKIKYNQDRGYYIFCYTLITIFTLIVLYPVIYVLSASFSNADRVVQGDVWLWPVDFSLDGYFEEARWLLREAGFKTRWILTNDGFKEVQL